MGFDIDRYMTSRRELVEQALARALPAAADRPAVLHKAMRYSVLSGGKRLRPILCMAAAEAVGGQARRAMGPAVAVEIFHTYTLIHDDLPCMDDDDVRRGRPTCHKVFGEANALLAGDALLTLAFELLGRTRIRGRHTAADLVTELAVAGGSRGVVGGQVEDLAFATARPTAARVRFIHLHKTADLFRAAVRLGAMAGQANAAQLRALTGYAVDLGLAFQIADDLLDTPPDSTGVPAAPAELTVLSVMPPGAARRRAERLIRNAIERLSSLPRRRAAPLVAIADLVRQRLR